MISGLLDEPYCKSEEQVKNLTMRQIALIYYRKRDKYGVPRPIEGEWFEDDDIRLAYKNFMGMGLAFGRSLEDLEKEWAEATKNGNAK